MHEVLCMWTEPTAFGTVEADQLVKNVSQRHLDDSKCYKCGSGI